MPSLLDQVPRFLQLPVPWLLMAVSPRMLAVTAPPVPLPALHPAGNRLLKGSSSRSCSSLYWIVNSLRNCISRANIRPHLRKKIRGLNAEGYPYNQVARTRAASGWQRTQHKVCTPAHRKDGKRTTASVLLGGGEDEWSDFSDFGSGSGSSLSSFSDSDRQ